MKTAVKAAVMLIAVPASVALVSVAPGSTTKAGATRAYEGSAFADADSAIKVAIDVRRGRAQSGSFTASGIEVGCENADGVIGEIRNVDVPAVRMHFFGRAFSGDRFVAGDGPVPSAYYSVEGRLRGGGVASGSLVIMLNPADPAALDCSTGVPPWSARRN